VKEMGIREEMRSEHERGEAERGLKGTREEMESEHQRIEP
jgi:hypothetical protein